MVLSEDQRSLQDTARRFARERPVKREWVPRMCHGDAVVAICLTEPRGGSDASSLQRRARRVRDHAGDHYVINSEKTSITFPPTVPLQRFGTEAEISAAIVYLLSPAAAYVTGTCLRVDGGTPNNRTSYWNVATHSRSLPFNGFHRSVPPMLLQRAVPAAAGVAGMATTATEPAGKPGAGKL